MSRLVAKSCSASRTYNGRELRRSNATKLGVTANHPLYSETRHARIPAGDLQPDEVVRTLNGHSTLTAGTQRPTRETVFDLEAHQRHSYHVSGPEAWAYWEFRNDCGRMPGTDFRGIQCEVHSSFESGICCCSSDITSVLRQRKPHYESNRYEFQSQQRWNIATPVAARNLTRRVALLASAVFTSGYSPSCCHPLVIGSEFYPQQVASRRTCARIHKSRLANKKCIGSAVVRYFQPTTSLAAAG
jgi:hypothetical protein